MRTRMNSKEIKEYLKNKVDNFRNIDFVVLNCDENDFGEIEIEAMLHNFSQHHKVYATINIVDFEEYLQNKENSIKWTEHQTFVQENF